MLLSIVLAVFLIMGCAEPAVPIAAPGASSAPSVPSPTTHGVAPTCSTAVRTATKHSGDPTELEEEVALLLEDGLWLWPLGGEKPRLLDASVCPHYGLSLAWSSDGRDIVFDDKADLWILSIETGVKRNLTSTGGRRESMPAFSPTGERVALASRPLDQGDLTLTSDCDELDSWSGALTLIESDGAGYRTVAEGSLLSPASWAPGGRRLAYAAAGHLFTYDLDSGISRELLPGEYGLNAESYLDAPAWSPCGDEIAVFFFAHGSPGSGGHVKQGYAILDLARDKVTVLKDWTAEPTVHRPALWSPDGQMVILAIERQVRSRGPAGLWLVRGDGFSWQLLGVPYQVQWSPDGDYVIYIDEDDRLLYIQRPWAAARMRVGPTEDQRGRGSSFLAMAVRPKFQP